MPAKNLYLDQSDIDWVEKERTLQARGFSNYITKLIRDDKDMKMSQRAYKAFKKEAEGK